MIQRLRATFALVIAIFAVSPAFGQQKPQALKIVVIQGEDAVNVVQQRTATTPIVEVRDRNDQPVAGAVVRFAIRSGRASFNGARAVSLTTNAAGQATATGLNATGSGALQITATATFQGQTAVATISQTNVIALSSGASSGAAAGGGSAAGGSAGGGAGAAAGAGAGGVGAGAAAAGAGAGASAGGLSVTTIAIVGGAAAGGAIGVNAALADDAQSGSAVYKGPFSGTLVSTVQLAQGTCNFVANHTGTLTIEVDVAADGSVTGIGTVEAVATPTGGTTCGGPNAGTPFNHGCCSPSARLSGNSGSLGFSGSHPGGSGTNWTYSFSGAIVGNDITGAFSLDVRSTQESGQFTSSVTLGRQ
jgi:hypothetical protein